MEGWVKLFRKFTSWEWYGDPNTKAMFIHCILKANISGGVWRGIHYEAGEFVTSLPSLCEDLGLTMRQARTSLTRLQATGEVTSRLTDKTTGKRLTKCRIITVNNWCQYQSSDRQNDSQATDNVSVKRQANDRQNDSRIRREEDKEEKKKEYILSENPTPYSQITELFQSSCHSFPKIRSLNNQRKAHIRNLLKTYTVDDFQTVFEKAEASDFLSGRTGKWNGCGFDWLIKPGNFLKVLEGNYDNKGSKSIDSLKRWAEGDENGQETDSNVIDVSSIFVS